MQKLLLSMHPLFQILTHSLFSLHLTPFWIWSWSPLQIPDLATLSLFCVCSDWASSSIWHSTYQTLTHWWNFQFCHLAGTRLENLFSYWGIPESDFLHHSIGPELHDCTGYHWLTHYNPLIEWVLRSIFFQQLLHHKSKSSPSIKTLPSSAPLLKLLYSVLDLPNPVPLVTPKKPLRITLINAAAYSHASKLEGSECFHLQISLPKVTGHSATTSEIPVNMSTVPKDYHDFMDIFSKSKAGKLADHQPNDLKITLDESTSLSYGQIYSLSQAELATLHKFIDKNLATGLIHPSCSPHGAPVLFIQTKDGSLWLCVDFWGLNWISKKDQYPLLLILTS